MSETQSEEIHLAKTRAGWDARAVDELVKVLTKKLRDGGFAVDERALFDRLEEKVQDWISECSGSAIELHLAQLIEEGYLVPHGAVGVRGKALNTSAPGPHTGALSNEDRYL